MAKDKKYHIAAGFLIAVFTFIILNSLTLALGTSILAGIAKETYDKASKKGTVEMLDIAATIAGGILATGFIYLLGRL